MKIKQFFLAVASVACIFGVAASASATTLYFGSLVNGYYPNGYTGNLTGSNGWLTATLTQNDTTTTLDLVATNNLGNDFVAGNTGNGNIGWAFDLTGEGTLNSSDVIFSSGVQANAINTGSIAIPSFLTNTSFNLALYWKANDFSGGDSATYTLNGLWSFGTTTDNLSSLVHVQNTYSCSGWIGDNGYSGQPTLANGTGVCASTSVSEPPVLPLMLYGIGLMAGLLLLAAKLRRTANP